MFPQPRRADYDRLNPHDRWDLPDRMFFACGACHILAYAFLQRHQRADTVALRIKPGTGFMGSHIIVTNGEWVFDYHGFSRWKPFLDHTFKRARHYWPGWTADFTELPADVLISEAKSRTYQGLWLREPGQFLHNALPRAEKYLDRFPL